MKVEELLRRYAAGERDFRSARLREANLVGVNLEGVNFRDAELCLADLSRANLADADLSNANLIGIDLVQAYCQRANFKQAKLLGADLRKTDFSQADFSDALLSGVLLNKANLHSANLLRAALSNAVLQETNLRDSNLAETNLAGADLRWASLIGAEIHRIDLIGYRQIPTLLPNGEVCPAHSKEVALFALEKFTQSSKSGKSLRSNQHHRVSKAQILLIQKFLARQFQLLSTRDLRMESSFDALQLSKTNGQLIASLEFAHELPRAIVRHDSEYWDLINPLLIQQHYVPIGRLNKHPAFAEYEHHELPPALKLYFGQARDLWSSWWPRQHQPPQQKSEILLLLDKHWHLTKQIGVDYGLVHITLASKLLTLKRNDLVTWLSVPSALQDKIAIDGLWSHYQ